jgi:ATP-dependent DNA ligase
MNSRFDGFRVEAIRSFGIVNLRSRKNKDFNARYPAIAKALSGSPTIL